MHIALSDSWIKQRKCTLLVKSINIDIWHEFRFKHSTLTALNADCTFCFRKSKNIWHHGFWFKHLTTALIADCTLRLLNKTEVLHFAYERKIWWRVHLLQVSTNARHEFSFKHLILIVLDADYIFGSWIKQKNVPTLWRV